MAEMDCGFGYLVFIFEEVGWRLPRGDEAEAEGDGKGGFGWTDGFGLDEVLD